MNEHIPMGIRRRGKYDLVKFKKFKNIILLGVKCNRFYTSTKGLSISDLYPLLQLLWSILPKLA